jgi:hypothetical protein
LPTGERSAAGRSIATNTDVVKKPPPQPWHRNPVVLLCGLGVLLTVGGYWLSRYLPMTTAEAEAEDARVQMQLILESLPVQGGPLADHLEQLRAAAIRARRTPPYHVPGLIAFYLGLAVLTSGVVWWLLRAPPAEAEDEDGIIEKA